MACPSCSPPATIWIERSRRPHSCRLPFGGDDPAAIGAGLGSLDPLRVSAFRREATSSKVSQHRTIVLDSIPGNAFLVPELTLAFNRPNYHTVKLHSPLECSQTTTGVFRRFSIPPRPPPALTHHLHLTRYAALYEKEGIYLYFSIRNQGINWLRHQYIAPFSEHYP